MLIKKFLTSSLQICSRCLSNEVNSWVSEKWADLDEEVKKQIREELKSIRLKTGSCVVCNNNLISSDTTDKILEILEENKVSKDTKEEFKRFFC